MLLTAWTHHGILLRKEGIIRKGFGPLWNYGLHVLNFTIQPAKGPILTLFLCPSYGYEKKEFWKHLYSFSSIRNTYWFQRECAEEGSCRCLSLTIYRLLVFSYGLKVYQVQPGYQGGAHPQHLLIVACIQKFSFKTLCKCGCCHHDCWTAGSWKTCHYDLCKDNIHRYRQRGTVMTNKSALKWNGGYFLYSRKSRFISLFSHAYVTSNEIRLNTFVCCFMI